MIEISKSQYDVAYTFKSYSFFVSF